MARSTTAFVLDDEIIVTAPVRIQVPQSARPGGGKQEQVFVTRTAFVDFRIPSEDQLDALNERIARENAELSRRLKDAQDHANAAGTDEEREEAERDISRINKEWRLSQVETLKAFAAGLPDACGIEEKDGSRPEFSADLIERLCAFRLVRAALWKAFLLLLNGPETARGN